MANKNLISAELPDEVKNAVLVDVDDIKKKMPFLISLADSDKPKRVMGPKSIDYVNLNLEGALQYPQKMTADFDVVEYRKDVTLVNQLWAIRIAVASLLGMIDDTMAAARSDSMKTSDDVYDNLKRAQASDGGIKDLVNRIAQRYEAQKKPRAKKVAKTS